MQNCACTRWVPNELDSVWEATSYDGKKAWPSINYSMVHPQNVRFQNVSFQNVRFQNIRTSGLQNVRFTKTSGLQNVTTRPDLIHYSARSHPLPGYISSTSRLDLTHNSGRSHPPLGYISSNTGLELIHKKYPSLIFETYRKKYVRNGQWQHSPSLRACSIFFSHVFPA